MLVSFQISNEAQAQGGTVIEEIEVEKEVDAPAIPDWVKNQFEWYLNGEIDEKTLLTSMNWLFDNNIMHLSEKAAQEVQEMRNEIDDLKYELEETKAAIAIPNLLDARKSGNESSAISSIATIDIPSMDGTYAKIFMVSGENTDINELVQFVLRESYMETNEDLEFYAEKVRYYNDLKEAIRDNISESRSALSTTNNPDILNSYSKSSELIGELVDSGVATESDWEDVIDQITIMQDYDTTDSVVDELAGIVVLCSTAIDKEIYSLQAEISLLQELSDMHVDDADSTRSTGDSTEDMDGVWWGERLSKVDQKIKTLQTGLKVLEEKLASSGDDAQLANIDLQNALQKQQQTLQSMSNVSKMLHDTGMAIIRKIG